MRAAGAIGAVRSIEVAAIGGGRLRLGCQPYHHLAGAKGLAQLGGGIFKDGIERQRRLLTQSDKQQTFCRPLMLQRMWELKYFLL